MSQAAEMLDHRQAPFELANQQPRVQPCLNDRIYLPERELATRHNEREIPPSGKMRAGEDRRSRVDGESSEERKGSVLATSR